MLDIKIDWHSQQLLDDDQLDDEQVEVLKFLKSSLKIKYLTEEEEYYKNLSEKDRILIENYKKRKQNEKMV